MNKQLENERLVAYVLGELDEPGRAAVEQALAEDEDARTVISDLRGVAALTQLTITAGHSESAALTDAQRETVRKQARKSAVPVAFPWGSVLAAGAAIAMLLFGLVKVVPVYSKIFRDFGGELPLPTRWVMRASDIMAGWWFALAALLTGLLVLAWRSSGIPEIGRRRLRLASRSLLGLALVLVICCVVPVQFLPIFSLGDVISGENAGVSLQYANKKLGEGPSFIGDPSKNYWPEHNTEAYDRRVDNPFLAVNQNPLSTFSIDVDTASYSNMRRFLNEDTLPPPDAIRIEELVNYFDYAYEPPAGEEPFAARAEVAGCPWAPDHRLVRLGLKGREFLDTARPPVNLVFLVDVSGSMSPDNKLPLVRRSLKLLVEQLRAEDRIALAVYASQSGVVLPPTAGDEKRTIKKALDELRSGGSTNGGAGIQTAYQLAADHFVKGGVNRVIICTDGDFNVGVTSEGDLDRLIKDRAKNGIFLTLLGFGMGNLKDAMLEKLADDGNGNYAYIDTLAEARKVLVKQMAANLITIAKDVKIQVEFNPAQVGAYRLLGYEDRMLADEDFKDDTKDAGEIGAGHTVTALYEVVPVRVPTNLPGVAPLKYQQPRMPAAEADAGDLMTIKLRYKSPDAEISKEMSFPVRDDGQTFEAASPDFKFASAVAGFGMILRQSEYKGTATFGSVKAWANEGMGPDSDGYRHEFVGLVEKAQKMHLPKAPSAPKGD